MGGVRIRDNVRLRNVGLVVEPASGRAIDIIAVGLLLRCGIPVAIDAILTSFVRTDGGPHDGADGRVGVALGGTRRATEVA